ncbi:MAG: DUF5615 family PIN-like protein [Saprospirales bacterium]|nr:DUF5615 family PIN-like protein [Saprospirales bacterium]
MLLLFDQNLSYKLVERLSDLFPGSTHVKTVGLDMANDWVVWEFARSNGYSIVTQDGDFFDIALVNGAPSKIIWLRCGNTSSSNIESILRSNFDLIADFILGSRKFAWSCFEIGLKSLSHRP